MSIEGGGARRGGAVVVQCVAVVFNFSPFFFSSISFRLHKITLVELPKLVFALPLERRRG